MTWRPVGAPRRPSPGRRRIENAEDVGLLHDQEVLAIDLHFAAGPLAEQDAVAGLDVHRMELAVLVAGAGADGDDFAFLRLFLGGVGDDDPALGLGFFFDASDERRDRPEDERPWCVSPKRGLDRTSGNVWAPGPVLGLSAVSQLEC